MTPTINVLDDAVMAQEVRVPPAKAAGWIAFYSCNVDAEGQHIWSNTMPNFDPSYSRDAARCPWPLFASREEAVSTAARALSNGGTVKVVRIEL